MLPNFLIIGANKAGTTSVAQYLGEHPQVFMSDVKEPTYFALDGEVPTPQAGREFTSQMVATRSEYEALFRGVEQEIAVGEASTAYLPTARAALRIKAEIPHVKLIAILRDPVERARSAHAMYVSRGLEPLRDFGEAVEAELAGCSWRKYVKLGFYHRSLSVYDDLFDRRQMKVFLYEDLKHQADVLREVFGWLGVDPDFRPDLDRDYNVSRIPRHQSVQRIVDGDSSLKGALKRVLPAGARAWVKSHATRWNSSRPPLVPDVRRRLVEVYEDDIQLLEGRIDRDLSSWLTLVR